MQTDHEWRLQQAAEGKAIYVPGKSVAEMQAGLKAAENARIPVVTMLTQMVDFLGSCHDTLIKDFNAWRDEFEKGLNNPEFRYAYFTRLEEMDTMKRRIADWRTALDGDDTITLHLKRAEALALSVSLEEIRDATARAEGALALLARMLEGGDFDGHSGLADMASLSAKGIGLSLEREDDVLNHLARRLKLGS